jgi:hypothetical protein
MACAWAVNWRLFRRLHHDSPVRHATRRVTSFINRGYP